MESGVKIPKEVESYIDWEAMARDWEINGGFIIVQVDGGRVAVFGSD